MCNPDNKQTKSQTNDHENSTSIDAPSLTFKYKYGKVKPELLPVLK